MPSTPSNRGPEPPVRGPALRRLGVRFDRIAVWIAGWGALLVLLQMVWISYGVVMRYGFNAPDGMVTEATALLLFPVAFAGLAYAMRENAYPKVTVLIDRLSEAARRRVDTLNLLVIVMIGGFFAFAAVRATISSFESGAASEILNWPRYWLWVQVAVSLSFFFVYAGLKLIVLLSDDRLREN